MTAKPALTVKIVKPGDKEQALRDFIAAHIGHEEANETGRVVEATLIALSPASPAARALASAGDAWAGATVRVRAIFASMETTAGAFGGDAAASVRRLCDVRLNDAHEQMVLDGSTTWIGDCLRRDPLRRDAFETFAIGAASTATRWATVSFERLWSHAVPVVGEAVATGDAAREAEAEADNAAGVTPANVDMSATALVSTRH